MKKNQAQGHRSSRIFRIFFISWMTCMLYIIPYPSMGQDKGITLNMKNAEATLIFLKIEQQSSYKFFYKTEQIKQLKNISIQVRNAPIKNVLDEIFNGTNFTYETTGEQIVVLEKKIEKKELITVTGNVKDTKGETIIGVAIVIKGTTSGVVTDINGNFSIKAAPDNILQFRFLGMKDKDLPIPANHQLNVIMEDDSRVIEEVVVTGYGDFKKSSYTGSASVVNMDKMKSLPVVSVTQMLEANLPGVSLYSNSGQPGSNVSMRIRGIGSFNASNEPLYVLDGVPITSGNMSSNDMNTGGLGFISTLNPADIENITVLKDAASASLYGARGANGVVLITTRKGSQGKTTYSLKASYGISDLAYTFRETMGGDERRELIREGYLNAQLDEGATPEAAAEYADQQADIYASKPANGYSDWFDELFRKGHQQSYDFSAMGGNSNTQFAGSISYTKQEGVSINSGFERLGGHFNFSNTYKRFDLAMNALLSVTKSKATPEGQWYSSAMYTSKYSLTPSVPIYNEDGTYNTNIPLNGNLNPLYENTINDYYTQVARTFASLEAGYTIIKGLKLSTSFNVDYTSTKDFRYFSPLSSDGLAMNGQGDMWMVENIRYNSNTRLAYSNSFGLHNVDATIAYEVQHWDHDDLFGEAKNYANTKNNTLSNASTPVSVGQTKKGDAMLSYVASVNYDYNQRYYLSFSFRRDGSSRLQKDNRWDNFWALSGSWRISQENFMMSLSSWLTDAKIRLSYGVNGNIPVSLYGFYGSYSTSWSYNEKPAMVESVIANDNLSWEKNYSLNFGIDLSLFDRVNISFDYYKRTTKDLLLDRQVNSITGFGTILDNVGEMENKGFELDIKSVNIQKANFSWSSALNMASNKNKIIKLADLSEFYAANYYIRKEGYSYGTICLREYAGVDPDNGKPMYYSNQEGKDGVRSREKVYDPNDAASIPLVDIYPKLTGGFTNTFRYYFADLSFNFSFSLGGHSYDAAMWALQDDGHAANTNKSVELRRRWQKPGDKTDIPRYVAGQEYGGWWHSSRGIHSTDHLRLKNFTLGISAPKRWTDVLGLSMARVYFSGTNLLTWASYDQYDPELTGTVEFNVPPLKTYAFGIEIGL